MELPTANSISVKQFRLGIAGLLVMIIVGSGNLYFSYQNYRQKIELEEALQQFRMTRTMLNARATIQMILIEAAKSGRPLTAEEIRVVDRLYVPAEYDTVERK